MAEQRVSIRKAMKNVKGVGDYIPPEQNTLVGHYSIIADTATRNKVHFDDTKYSFDEFAGRGYKAPELSHDQHPHFQQYKWVRRNLTLVRNYVMQSVLESMDPADPNRVEKANKMFAEMGTALGKAMRHDSLFFGYMDSLKVEEAGVPGLGAVAMYKKLLQKQSGNPVAAFFRKVFLRRDYSAWPLPPLDETPFNAENVKEFEDYSKSGESALTLSAAPVQAVAQPVPALPQVMPLAPEPALEPAQPSFAQLLANNAGKLAALAGMINGTARSLAKIEKLPNPVKKEAVELARNILRNLRMDSGEVPIDQWRMRPPDQMLAEGNALGQAANTYAGMYQQAIDLDRLAAGDPVLLQANMAVSRLDALMKMQSLEAKLAEGVDIAAIDNLRQQVDAIPAELRDMQGITVGELAAQIEAGLDRSLQICEAAQMAQPNTASQIQGASSISPDVLRALKNTKAADPVMIAQMNQAEKQEQLRQMQAPPIQQRTAIIPVPAERKPIVPVVNHQELVAATPAAPEAARRR